MKADQEQRGGATPYRTSTRGVPPPLVSTQFTVQDDGECWGITSDPEFNSSPYVGYFLSKVTDLCNCNGVHFYSNSTI